jgi:lysyl-tRNA synthetase class 2
MFRNVFGKAMFLRVQDRGEPSVVDDSGEETVVRGGVIQLYARKNEVGDEVFALLKRLDIGDIVWGQGKVMRTRTGELTIQLDAARLASKTLTPFPDRWHAVSDVQTRSRQRYVDLFINAESRRTFVARSRIVKLIRDFFHDREYHEVETPILQTIPGGATARPFRTHHNALDIELYLRVAPELFLKRLVVGGMDRVFEINRSFRNEGVSPRHNPEFTMLEFYEAWATVHDLMGLTEELLSGLAMAITGSTTVQFGGREVNFAAPYRRADMDELIAERTGLSRQSLRSVEVMAGWWREHRAEESDGELPSTVGKWWEWLFEATVEEHLVDPVFVTGFPTEISPLARRSDADPFVTDRFEIFVAGWEIGNGFTELNDPVDQAGRFADQVAQREAGDDESMYFDHDYIRALTYALPPTAGQGIGIDRVVMLLTGREHIRDVILFPTMRPERWGEGGQTE